MAMRAPVLIVSSLLAFGGSALLPAASAKQPEIVKVCVAKKSGQMRMVGSKKACHRGERFVKWRTTPKAARPGAVTVIIACNVTAEANADGTAARSVRTIRIPLGNGESVAVAVTCANGVAG